MSLSILEAAIEEKARLFSVLGDSTRLKLVTNLLDGEAHSISDLSEGFQVSRQAVTKHLRLLESAGIVGGEKSGRENLYTLRVDSLTQAREIIESIESQWEQTIARLKSLVED